MEGTNEEGGAKDLVIDFDALSAEDLWRTGRFFLSGLLEYQDPEAAYQCFCRGAAKPGKDWGVLKSRSAKYQCLVYGVGVKQSMPALKKLKNLAQYEREPRSALAIALLPDLDPNLKCLYLSYAWYCGSTRALAELARIKHRRGDGPEVAEEWYKEAMEKGCETAIYYKGFDLYLESDAEEDRARGLELLKRAAAAGSSEALFWLAHYYEEDKARPAEVPDPLKLWTISALMGNDKAMNHLMLEYTSGKPSRQNPKKAEEWEKRLNYTNNRIGKEIIFDI